MKIDLETTIKEMVLAVKNSVLKDSGQAGDVTRLFLEANRERYRKLVDFRLSGKIDEADFNIRLDDEKRMLEAQLNTLKILSKVKAQNAANAAFNVLESVVNKLLKLV